MNRIFRKSSIPIMVRPLLIMFLCAGFKNASGAEGPIRGDAFSGRRAGAETNVGGIQLCWCPAGKFIMGSPPDELERRTSEDQVRAGAAL